MEWGILARDWLRFLGAEFGVVRLILGHSELRELRRSQGAASEAGDPQLGVAEIFGRGNCRFPGRNCGDARRGG